MARRNNQKFLPEMTAKAHNLSLLGKTAAEMAESMGVTWRTFMRWCREKPEFLEAVKSGGIVADGQVIRSLYERACGYSHPAVKIFMPVDAKEPVYAPYIEHYPPDTAAAFIWLKNRQRKDWRDRHEVEVTGTIEHQVSAMTPEQRRLQLRALLDEAQEIGLLEDGRLIEGEAVEVKDDAESADRAASGE